MDRVPPAMNMTSTSNWFCFKIPASLVMLNSTASVLAGELVPTRNVVSCAEDIIGGKRKRKIENAAKQRSIVQVFCITISATILRRRLRLELEQLKGGVNRDVKEVRFATRADFAYIETNSFYVSQYFLGGCSSWRH